MDQAGPGHADSDDDSDLSESSDGLQLFGTQTISELFFSLADDLEPYNLLTV